MPAIVLVAAPFARADPVDPAARSTARKLGRLVEASERYLDVSRMTLERGSQAVMRKALVDAVTCLLYTSRCV